jgi:tetratricopeptide (TPR) repeat protein
MHNLTNAYSATGRREDATRMREELLPLLQKALGAEHPETLGAMNNLANSYSLANRMPEAIALQKQTLAIARRVLPKSDPQLKIALRNMTGFYMKAGQLEAVLPLLIEPLLNVYEGWLPARAPFARARVNK